MAAKPTFTVIPRSHCQLSNPRGVRGGVPCRTTLRRHLNPLWMRIQPHHHNLKQPPPEPSLCLFWSVICPQNPKFGQSPTAASHWTELLLGQGAGTGRIIFLVLATRNILGIQLCSCSYCPLKTRGLQIHGIILTVS